MVRRGDYAPVSLFSQSAQGCLETPQIEFRVAFDAVAFVQDDDRPWADAFHDGRGDLSGVASNGVEPANAPTNEDETTALELRVEEQVF